MINFFIDRPIFATVLSLIITLVGVISVLVLPIAEFPEITPPSVQITSEYTGAGAEVVSESVTTPIEEQVNGVEGMVYMSSNSTGSGVSVITITFEVGYDQDIAAVDVQNRASLASPGLPDIVNRTGIAVSKVSTDFALVVSLISPNGTYDGKYLGNYADIHVTDELSRVPGVGSVTSFGLHRYSMRIWLDPDKLARLGLTGIDVADAVTTQNVQVPAGQVGHSPAPAGQLFEFQLKTEGRLETVRQFEDIIVRTRPDGSVVRIRDVATVDLGAEDYSTSTTLNGRPTATIGVYQLPDANALDVSEQVRAAMERLAVAFPEDIEYTITYDSTTYVMASLSEVVKTLVMAFILVCLVTLLFLQKFRAVAIPSVAIPVALIGTFGLLLVFGFSINTLSLLGIVLAVGLVVDDAIVVVENVERQLEGGNKTPRQAARDAMVEVRGPIVATTLVLMAVFVPVAFMPGMAGRLYNQFSLTIAFSVGLSAIVSLSLSPALCAVMLRRRKGASRFFFYRWFDRAFEASANGYKKSVRVLARGWIIVLVVFGGLGLLTWHLFSKMPTGFVPEEDQGYFMVLAEGQPGASLERITAVTDRMERILADLPAVRDVFIVNGYNIMSGVSDSSAAFGLVILDDWDERQSADLSVTALIQEVHRRLSGITEAYVYAFNVPPIRGVGKAGGFEFLLQDRATRGVEALSQEAKALMGKLSQRPEVTALSTTFRTDVPQLLVDVDRTKAMTLGVSPSDLFEVLQINLGSLYVNDFNLFGKTYRVILQADAENRSTEKDISRLYVRSRDGEMVPLSTLVSIRHVAGLSNLPHYNLYASASITGEAAPGYSSGDAIVAVEEEVQSAVSRGYGYEWTGLVYQQLKAGKLAPIIFALALVFVFLFLAAQYESWTMPFMIILAVPLALLGATAALTLRGFDLDIYGQIGLVMLIGLSAKNAILIAEFAQRLRSQGCGIVEAAAEAARLRLRPILMTALAFMLGVLPLVLADGAGAACRRAIGTTVFGGMLAATFLSLGIVPVFYVVIEGLRTRFSSKKGTAGPDHPAAP